MAAKSTIGLKGPVNIHDIKYSILSVGHARRRLLRRVHSEQVIVDCTTEA